jgi:DNA-binding transcriptional MocR family regulator
MIVLGPRAYELRAYVGATAWSVLEEMMQRSHGDGDHVVALVSIRSLASSLGLAKDTVNRAVRRLRDLGVIEAVQARSEAGVFEAGSYRLAVPVACISVACPSQPSVAPPTPRASSARRSSGQLSLLSEV